MRIADYERKARETEDAARIGAIREMQDRHAKEGVLLQQLGARVLSEIDHGNVTAEAAIRAITEGARLERLARGEATERTETKEAADPRLEVLTDEQLERAIEFAAGTVHGAEPAQP